MQFLGKRKITLNDAIFININGSWQYKFTNKDFVWVISELFIVQSLKFQNDFYILDDFL